MDQRETGFLLADDHSTLCRQRISTCCHLTKPDRFLFYGALFHLLDSMIGKQQVCDKPPFRSGCSSKRSSFQLLRQTDVAATLKGGRARLG
jgi:hypothetical protein